VTAARAWIGERVRAWGRGLSPAIALLGAMAFITQVGVSIMLPLLPLYATHLGATPTVLGLLTSSFAILIAVGQLAGGYLVERIAPRRLVSIGIGTYLGDHSDTAFGIALLASGLSSSSVGTLAGQVVMQGFIRRRIPLFLRRAITMAPALLIIALGIDASRALVLSQVLLSFGIPFALIPLLWFCRDRSLMGVLVNRRSTTALAAAIAVLIICLNGFLLEQTLL